MRKFSYILIALFLLGFASCKKQEVLEPKGSLEEDFTRKGGKLPASGGTGIVETEDEDEDQDESSSGGGWGSGFGSGSNRGGKTIGG